MLNWLIQENILDRNDEFKAEIEKQGMKCKIADNLTIRVNPYTLFTPESSVIYRGSLDLLHNIDQCKWSPGALCNRKDYNFSNYSSSLGEYLLNSKYHLLNINELNRRAKELVEYYNTPFLFVKLDNGCQTFFESKIRDVREITPNFGINLAVVAPPKTITREWRFYVANKQAFTGSLYTENKQKKFEEVSSGPVFDYANFIASEMGKDFVNEEIFVLDVCEHRGDLFVLEINCFSCSGVYACNIPKIVATAKEIFNWI